MLVELILYLCVAIARCDVIASTSRTTTIADVSLLNWTRANLSNCDDGEVSWFSFVPVDVVREGVVSTPLFLTFSDFSPSLRRNNILRGIEVRAIRRQREGSTDRVTDRVTVHWKMERFERDNNVPDFLVEDVVYGGQSDTWGVNDLTIDAVVGKLQLALVTGKVPVGEVVTAGYDCIVLRVFHELPAVESTTTTTEQTSPTIVTQQSRPSTQRTVVTAIPSSAITISSSTTTTIAQRFPISVSRVGATTLSPRNSPSMSSTPFSFDRQSSSLASTSSTTTGTLPSYSKTPTMFDTRTLSAITSISYLIIDPFTLPTVQLDQNLVYVIVGVAALIVVLIAIAIVMLIRRRRSSRSESVVNRRDHDAPLHSKHDVMMKSAREDSSALGVPPTDDAGNAHGSNYGAVNINDENNYVIGDVERM